MALKQNSEGSNQWPAAVKRRLRAVVAPVDRHEQILSHYVTGRKNNFTVLRFVAASSVLFGHSFALTKIPGYGEPVRQALGGQTWIGALAVETFFVISGFLVAASFINQANIISFFKSRILRVFPALITCLIITVFVILPPFVEIPLGEYFSNSSTYEYIFKNLMYDRAWYRIDGVFESNPRPGVNGSLWTLPAEIRAYICLGLLGAAGVFKKRTITNIAIGALLIWGFVDFASIPLYALSPSYARLGAYFLIGVFFYVNRDWIILDGRIATFLGVALFLSSGTVAFHVALAAFVGYGVMYFVYRVNYLKLNEWGDYSYGIYIYAFPVQQCTVSALPDLTPYQHMAIAFPITLAFAFLSWHIVEKHALKLKRVDFVELLSRIRHPSPAQPS